MAIGGFALIVLLPALALWAWFCLWFPLTDTDIWWHLATAQWMAAHHAVPRTDPFCYSSFGAPWFDLQWGFQIFVGLLWKAGGAFALVFAKCAILVASLGLLLWPHLRRSNAAWLLPAAALGIYHVRYFLDMRPLVITLFALSAQYALIQFSFRGGRKWLRWGILPLQILMVNVQGLFPLGLVLVFALVFGEAWQRREAQAPGRSMGAFLRPWWALLIVLLLTGFANPYGWQGYALPLALFARIVPTPDNIFSSEIAENLPLWTLAQGQVTVLLPWIFLGALGTWAWLRGRDAAGRRDWGHGLVFLSFGVLGLMAQRNLPLSLWALIMILGRVSNLGILQEYAKRPVSTMPLRYAWLGMIAVGLLYLVPLKRAWEYELPGTLLTPFRFPIQASEFLAAHPMPGQIFNELRFGGYMDFRLTPHVKPFVDGRMILRNAEFYREFISVVDHPHHFDSYRRRHGLTQALLPIGEDRRYVPLAAYLLRQNWSLLYCDGAAILLADPAVASVPNFNLHAFVPGQKEYADLNRRFQGNAKLLSLAQDNVKYLRVAWLSEKN